MLDPALSPEENEHWVRFVELLRQAFEQGVEFPVLQLLMTPDERSALATRVRIVQELMRGELSQRELKELLGVGIATITRGSNSLKTAPHDVKLWLEKELMIKKIIAYSLEIKMPFNQLVKWHFSKIATRELFNHSFIIFFVKLFINIMSDGD